MKPSRVGVVVAIVVLLSPLSAAWGQDREDQREVERGREADRQIEALYGFYDDPELTEYVTGIGDRLAALSERPQLPWTFRVLDSPVVNAFAVPGGFVYVTRGLVAYAGSEAELAGVIGHEIGHITGRHSGGRQWGSIFATLGIVAGAILSDTFRDLLDVGVPQLVSTLFLTKYSRDQELDADRRGIRYATMAGYNAYAIGGFFVTLQNLEEHHDRKGLPGWLSTHPQIDDRIERSNRAARETVAQLGVREDQLLLNRRELLDQVDGVVFGENPREGYMDGNAFLHPDLRFRVDFPDGWDVANGRSAVVVTEPRQRAVIRLELAPLADDETPADHVRDYLRRLRANVLENQPIRVNDLEAVEARFTVDSDGTRYAVLGDWISYDGRLYKLLGITSPASWRTYLDTLERSLHSFDELDDPGPLDIQPARVEVVELARAMTLAGVIEAHPEISVEPQIIVILNHLSMDDLIDAGDAVKLVFGGPGAP